MHLHGTVAIAAATQSKGSKAGLLRGIALLSTGTSHDIALDAGAAFGIAYCPPAGCNDMKVLVLSRSKPSNELLSASTPPSHP